MSAKTDFSFVIYYQLSLYKLNVTSQYNLTFISGYSVIIYYISWKKIKLKSTVLHIYIFLSLQDEELSKVFK